MAQKQYGIIPHDTSQVGYGQDTPVVDHEAMKKRMVEKLKKNRKKKKEEKDTMANVTKDAVSSIEQRQQALDEAANDNKQ